MAWGVDVEEALSRAALYMCVCRGGCLSFTLSRATLYPILTVLLGNAGMLAFVALCALEAGEGGAGLVSGMVSLYMVLPVVWGIALRGERASAQQQREGPRLVRIVEAGDLEALV